MPSSLLATSGISAQSALAQLVKTNTCLSALDNTDEWRIERRPPRMPPYSVYGGRPSTRALAGRRKMMKTITATIHRAIARNTEALFHQAIIAPARAGPRARVALIEMPLRDTAAGTC